MGIPLHQVEGDVTANNRKNKLILLYDLEVTIDWKGVHGFETPPPPPSFLLMLQMYAFLT